MKYDKSVSSTPPEPEIAAIRVYSTPQLLFAASIFSNQNKFIEVGPELLEDRPAGFSAPLPPTGSHLTG